tara:strand:- start:3534 stop:4031 length:498 start_codon:yes stop_codon:yes gene_type:complete
MWTIIKFDKDKLHFLKEDLSKKLGKDYKIYIPRLIFKKYKNNKIINKEFNLLGDYLFCFHKKFEDSKVMNSLIYTRGLKYFLNGFMESQGEIKNFIQKCKNSEDKNGYLCNQFYELKVNSSYQFFSGPFTNAIFKIIELQKHKINVLIGNLKTTINKKEFLFKPI